MKTTLLFLSIFLTTALFGQNVYIPDANFKAYLVGNPEINTNGDTEIQVSEASTYDGSISCIYLNITDLTGIEAFTALTWLDCRYNQLTSLDISNNISLTYLDCSYNQLAFLDVSQNSSLEKLFCSDNQLINLDVTENTFLDYLRCDTNQLTSLDVSQNIDLIWLGCGWNQLTSLDVSQNTALQHFDFSQNQLTSLDVSQNTTLTYLFFGGNQLTSLDVSQNTALTRLSCYNNQLTCLNIANGNNANINYLHTDYNPNLTCIQVDDAAYSTANWTSGFFYIDPQTSFSENCDYPSDCFTSSLTELSTSKNLIQILDLMGRETTFKPNTPLIYVYDDGSTEKVFSVEY